VFVRIIHLLTLFAFATHASLGCCLHDSHSAACASPCEPVRAASSGHSHDCHGHRHCSDGEAVSPESESAFLIESSVNLMICLQCSKDSHQHSHDCVSRCTYIASRVDGKLRWGDPDAPLIFTDQVFCDAHQFACSSFPSAYKSQDHALGFRIALNTTQRCASIQSWQL
jgi:hypothetical protein